MIYGVDAYRNKITSHRDETGQADGTRPEGLDGKSQTLGTFVKADIPLTEGWMLQSGVRYDYFSATDNRSDSDVINKKQSDSSISPSLALLWESAEWLTLVASYNEAFRAPGMQEMFTTGTHFHIDLPAFVGPDVTNEFVPNPDLKPERAQNKEISARMQFEELLGDDELKLNANLFRNDVDNFINQYTYDRVLSAIGPMDTKTSWKNVDKAVLEGFEIAGKYRYQQIEAGLSYGQTRGEDKKTGVALGNIPADKWVGDLGWRFLEGDLKLGGRYTHAKDQNRVDPAASVTSYEGYDLVDLYLTYEPLNGQLKGFKADVAVNNLADKYYRMAWQTLYMPGRNYKLNLRYKF